MPPISTQTEPLGTPPLDARASMESALPVSLVKIWHFILSDHASHFFDTHTSKGDKSTANHVPLTRFSFIPAQVFL